MSRPGARASARFNARDSDALGNLRRVHWRGRPQGNEAGSLRAQPDRQRNDCQRNETRSLADDCLAKPSISGIDARPFPDVAASSNVRPIPSAPSRLGVLAIKRETQRRQGAKPQKRTGQIIDTRKGWGSVPTGQELLRRSVRADSGAEAARSPDAPRASTAGDRREASGVRWIHHRFARRGVSRAALPNNRIASGMIVRRMKLIPLPTIGERTRPGCRGTRPRTPVGRASSRAALQTIRLAGE